MGVPCPCRPFGDGQDVAVAGPNCLCIQTMTAVPARAKLRGEPEMAGTNRLARSAQGGVLRVETRKAAS
jgi:hypothetical protein